MHAEGREGVNAYDATHANLIFFLFLFTFPFFSVAPAFLWGRKGGGGWFLVLGVSICVCVNYLKIYWLMGIII